MTTALAFESTYCNFLTCYNPQMGSVGSVGSLALFKDILFKYRRSLISTIFKLGHYKSCSRISEEI